MLTWHIENKGVSGQHFFIGTILNTDITDTVLATSENEFL